MSQCPRRQQITRSRVANSHWFSNTFSQQSLIRSFGYTHRARLAEPEGPTHARVRRPVAGAPQRTERGARTSTSRRRISELWFPILMKPKATELNTGPRRRPHARCEVYVLQWNYRRVRVNVSPLVGSLRGMISPLLLTESIRCELSRNPRISGAGHA